MTGMRRDTASAMQRAALTLQLVPYLVAHGDIAVRDVAADFDVTADRVREMVRALTTMGLPGDSGYWQMPDDLFDIDWDLFERDDIIALTNVVGLDHAPRLTAREAAALLAGLQLVRTLPGVVDESVIDGLLTKLARGTSSTPAEVVVAPEPVDGVRALVQEALQRRRAIAFTYRAPDVPATTRTVDPVEVVIADGQWYVRGWCHLRHAMRTFHLDRVTDPVLTDIVSTHQPESEGTVFGGAADADIIRLQLRPESMVLLGGYADGARIEPDAANGNEADGRGTQVVRIRAAGPNSLKRTVTGLGGDAEIVEPAEARRAVRRWAERALAQYGPAADTAPHRAGGTTDAAPSQHRQAATAPARGHDPGATAPESSTL